MLPFLLVLTEVASPAIVPPIPQKPLMCKRESVTGSLARVRKICKTADQWRVLQNQAQDESRTMQDRGLINSEAPK